MSHGDKKTNTRATNIEISSIFLAWILKKRNMIIGKTKKMRFDLKYTLRANKSEINNICKGFTELDLIVLKQYKIDVKVSVVKLSGSKTGEKYHIGRNEKKAEKIKLRLRLTSLSKVNFIKPTLIAIASICSRRKAKNGKDGNNACIITMTAG